MPRKFDRHEYEGISEADCMPPVKDKPLEEMSPAERKAYKKLRGNAKRNRRRKEAVLLMGGGRPRVSEILNNPKRKPQLDKFFEALELGLHMGSASAYAKLSAKTVEKWLGWGRRQQEQAETDELERATVDDRPPKLSEPNGSPEHAYWRFLQRVEQSKATMQFMRVKDVVAAGEAGKYNAALAILGSHDPAWRSKGHLEVKKTETHTLEIHTGMSRLSLTDMEAGLEIIDVEAEPARRVQ